MSKSGQSGLTISQVFEEFLDDQKTRISPKTLSKYQSIISLYKSYLENAPRSANHSRPIADSALAD